MIQILTLVILIIIGYCRVSADLSVFATAAVYQCVMQSGYQNFCLRIQDKTNALNPNSVQALSNMKNLGITPDISLLVCRNRSISETVNAVLNGIPRNLYQNIWIEIDANMSDSHCSWFGNKTNNCQFLKDLLKQFKKHGQKPGIQSQQPFWNLIFNGTLACPLEQLVPLGYLSYDYNPDFKDFVPFGMWKTPNKKKYIQNITVCGLTVNPSYQI